MKNLKILRIIIKAAEVLNLISFVIVLYNCSGSIAKEWNSIEENFIDLPG